MTVDSEWIDIDSSSPTIVWYEGGRSSSNGRASWDVDRDMNESIKESCVSYRKFLVSECISVEAGRR